MLGSSGVVLIGSPSMAAVFSSILLSERPSRTTSIAIVLSMGGVYVMYREGLFRDNLQKFFSILSPIASGLNFTTLRRHPSHQPRRDQSAGGCLQRFFGIAMSGGHITLPLPLSLFW